jgi:hypothetical protein
MKKLIGIAALLGGSLLPMVPSATAQVIVHRPGRTVVVGPRGRSVRRGRFMHRGRWYGHRRWRRGRWVYW